MLSVPPELPEPPPFDARRKGPGYYFAVAYLLLCVWSIGYAVFGSATGRRQSTNFLAVILIAYLAVFFLLGIHEIGHAVFGRMVGFRCHELVIGPARLVFADGGMQCHFNRIWWLPFAWASSAPTGVRWLRLRTAVFTIGGPATNALLWATVSLYYWRTGLPRPASPSAAATVIQIAGISGYLAAVNLFPVDFNNGLVLDGARLFMLAFLRRKAERFCAVLALGGSNFRGVRPRDWDPNLVRNEDTLDDCHVDLGTACWYGYHYYLDQREICPAGDRLWTAIAVHSKITKRLPGDVGCEAAYYCATFSNQLPVARVYYEQAIRNQCDAAVQTRAEAAILLAEGKFREALQVCHDGLDAPIGEYPTGIQRAGREWLESLCEQAMRSV